MTPDHPLSPETHELLASGRKIEGIKRIREETGLGLKEAKDLADAFSAQRGRRVEPAPAMQEEGGAIGIVAIVIAILLAALLYVLFLSD